MSLMVCHVIDAVSPPLLCLIGATKKLLQYIKDLVGVNLVEVKLSFPIHSPQQVGGVIIIT